MNKIQLLIRITFICLLLIASGKTFAANRYSVANNNWSNTATWSATSGGAGGASVPVAGDVVYIEGNRTVTVNVASACANVNVASGSTLIVGGFNFTVSGTTTIRGIINHTSRNGTKTMGNVVMIGGTWTDNVGETYAITNMTLSGATFNGTSRATYTVSGTMSVTTGTTNTFNLANITVTGSTTVNGTIVFANTSGTKTFAGVTIAGGTWTNNAAETYGMTSLTLSGSTISGSATGTFNVNGNLSVTAGSTNTLNPATFTITGASTIDGTFTIASNVGSKTFVGRVTVGAAGVWNNTGNESVVFRGGITNDGTFTAGTGTHTFNTNSQSIYGTLVIPTISITTPTVVTNYGAITCATSFTGTGGFTQSANSTLNLGGTATVTTQTMNAVPNLVNYYGAAAQTVRPVAYYNLTLQGGGIKTLTGVSTINNDLILAGTATATTAINTTIGRNLVIGNGTTFTAAGFNLTVNGTTTVGSGTSGRLTISSATGTKTFVGLVTLNNGAIWTNNTANSPVFFRGGITNSGTFNAGTGIHTFNINDQALTGVFTIPNVTVTGVTLTNNNTLTASTTLSGTGGLSQADNATLNIGGTSLISTLNANSTVNTVNYTSAVAQTVKAVNYYNLTLSGGGAKTLNIATTSILGDLTISGTASATGVVGLTIGNDFILSGGTFTSGAFTHNIAGDWNRSGGTFTPGAGTINFNGSANQSIGGTVATTFNNIIVDNPAGATLSNAINAAGVSLTNGIVITTSTNLLTVTGSTPTSITGSASSYISGPLARTLPASLVNGSYLFPIGKSGYNPFELIGANTTSGGTVVVRAEVMDANCGGTAGVGMSDLNTNRYWATSITSGTANFTNSQVQLTESGMTDEYAIGQSATQTGAYDRISNTPPSGSTIISDPDPNKITTLSYFVVGKKPILTIAATTNGTEGGSNGLFTITTSKQFSVARTVNLAITGTATNGTDYTTINTTVNFPAGQTTITIPVTVTNDASVEPTETVIITIQDGTGYAVGTPDNATVNIYDNDVAGITITPTSGLTTTEATGVGQTATFTMVLTSQPTADVTVGLSSSNSNEGTVSPSSVTFTSANWNSAQTVTITGVDELVDDDNVAYTIVTAQASSSDLDYKNFDPSDVSVTNIDNDVAGITVSPTSGLTTTEGLGTATFTIVLNTKPTASVTIGLSSNDATEGSVSPASVTFTTANWNTARTITVTGVNDFIIDGNISYNIVTAAASSTDGKYSGMNPSDVSVTNNDNDVAGITVNPTSGLNTSEAGGQATFTIVLNAQPSNNVTIALSSDNTNEGTVSPSSVTFTSGNWNSAQTVTVTGVNDLLDDGDITYHIVTGAASSSDANFNGINPSDVTVVNLDNDVAGISINPISGLVTTEAGGTATFTIVLNTQPTANVTIGLSSSNINEGTVSSASVTFTTANWSTQQTVTITGVNDFIDDGNIAYSITTAAATSTDLVYNGINASDVSVTNTDDDVAGITVDPTIDLITTEAGGIATFTIKLNSQPTANVTIGLSSSNIAEGTVSPASVTFTSGNWNSAQTITVTGVNDFVEDGDIDYTIITAAASSTDGLYSGLNASDVSITNTDDDVSGVTITPTSGLVTTEAGGTATFTIKLNSQPTANVTIGLSSNDVTEGTVSPASVTFTSGNWSTTQTITATGVNDFMVDGNMGYTILTVMTPGADLLYNAIDPADVSVTNNDNDFAGFTVTPTSGLTVTEASGAGHTATVTIKLNSQPSANVVIGISSNDATEGTVSPASLTFTNANWNTTQTVTITGVNDDVDDGDVAFSIVTAPASSGDGNYNNLNPTDVSVTNIDNDVAGITVSPTSGLVTTEAGGTATFSIVLTSQPTANVTIGISSSDATEGSVSPSSVTFTSGNWNSAQTVTVSGIDDYSIDGNISYTIITAAATSTDGVYSGMNAADVSAVNNDDDIAQIVVTPTSGLTTEESGTTATFTIELTSIPTANVTINLSTSDATEGTVSPASVVLNSSNWNTPQVVTITGVNDDVNDDNISYSIITSTSVSTDGNYNNINPSDVSVTNIDDDVAGITVDPTSGLVTSEDLTSATFTIVLESQPTANVTINLSVDDNSEGSVSPTSVTFTSANWSTAKTITVTGKNDNQSDGDIVYNVITAAATSTDGKYSGMNADDVEVTNLDNDTPGITVSPLGGLVTTEAGGTATFTVVLLTQPTDNVSIDLASSDLSEGTVSPSTITFTNGNWNSPQTITVTGANDALVDGDISFTITLSSATSNDNDYDGLDPDDVSVTNNDRTPTIGSFAPGAVCYGSGASVVISGTFFTGATSVTMNGVSASYTVNNSTQITAMLPATTTTGTISVVTPTGTAVSSSSLIVDAVSVGGTLSGGASVCPFTNSTLLTLAGQTGSIQNWQSSPNGSAWSDFANTSNSFTSTNISATTHYRVAVKNGSCTTVYSSAAIVTATDAIKPTVTVSADTIVQVIASGSSASVTVPLPTVTDNCSATATNNFNGTANASGTYPTGETLVIWTATDPSSNIGKDSQRVFVAAYSVLSITCPVGGSLGCNPTIPAAGTPTTNTPWPWVLVSSWNNYPGVETGGPCDYTTTIRYYAQWKVFGVFGSRIDSCDQVYTYKKDVTKPTISCVGNQTKNVDAGQCFYTVSGSEFNPTATNDNCGIASVINRFNGASTLANAQIPVGTTTIKWVITDICGNKDSCTFDVTVSDNISPSITCKGNHTVNTNSSDCKYTQSGTTWDATATDNCTVSSLTYNLTGATTGSGSALDGVEFNAGETFVTWTASDGTNSVTCKDTIKVLKIEVLVTRVSVNYDCPQFLSPFNANTNTYNAGATEVIFKVERINSTEDWSFDYVVSGTHVTVNGASPNPQTGTKILGGSSSYNMRFFVNNIPGEALSIDFNVTNVFDTNCTNTGVNTSENINLKSMPVVGSFD